MDSLLAVLPAGGAWMEFSAFVAAARAAGARPELWRRAKQSGLLEARISEAGVHEVRRVA